MPSSTHSNGMSYHISVHDVYDSNIDDDTLRKIRRDNWAEEKHDKVMAVNPAKFVLAFKYFNSEGWSSDYICPTICSFLYPYDSGRRFIGRNRSVWWPRFFLISKEEMNEIIDSFISQL